MKTRFLIYATDFLILLGLLLPHSALGQTYVCDDVPGSSPDPTVQLFQFNTPDNTTAGDTWVIAKFVVDDTATDLNFRLEPTTLANFPVTDFKISDANVPLLDPSLSPPDNQVATLRVRDLSPTEPTSNPAMYRIIRISIDYDDDYPFPATEVWRLRAHKPAAVGTTFHFWGFWNQGSGESTVNTSVTQPKLINVQTDLTACASFSDFTSPTNISFGDVHINLASAYIPDEQYEFVNVGTQPLNITAANPASMPASAYNIENYPSPPLSVGPMGSFSRRVTCQPTSVGAIADVNVSLTTDSIGTLVLNLTGSRGMRLSSGILFDISGSMLWDKNGASGVPPDQQKIYAARIAALELVELYEQLLPEARLALYTYPNLAGTCPSSQELIPLNEIKNNQQSFKNRFDAGLNHADLLTPPDASTPMAAGIERAYNALPKNEADQRAAVFHFGDGQHNCDSAGSKADPDDWYNDMTFRNAGIPFFTIPYGASGAGWLQTFQSLSSNTSGNTFPADITDDLQLQTQFKKALGDALDLETLKDPEGQISQGQTRNHDVCVTASSRQLVFSVHWQTRNAQAISVSLVTPGGSTITPQTVAADPSNLGYASGLTFADYVVRGNYLRGANGSGQWTLRLVGNVSTPYVYQVYAYDGMKTQRGFDLAYLGHAAEAYFVVENGNQLVRELSVTAQYDRPSASFYNYLATSEIDPNLVLEAPTRVGEQQLTLAERKLYALVNFGQKPFPAERVRGQLTLAEEQPQEPRRQGRLQLGGPWVAHAQQAQAAPQNKVLRAAFTDAPYDGLYNIRFTVTGVTVRGECFERDYMVSRWADVLLTPELILDQVEWTEAVAGPFFDRELVQLIERQAQPGFVRRSIQFTPRDANGNYFGIGRAAEINFQVEGAEKLGGIQEDLQGRYIQVVEFREGDTPSVAVSVSGVAAPAVSMKAAGISWLWILLLIVLILVVVIILIVRR